MKRLLSAFLGSILIVVFVGLTSSPLVMLATFPLVGRPLAASMCDGTVAVETANWSQPNGEFGARYEYACVAESGVSSPISALKLMVRAGIFLAVIVGLVVWPLLFALFWVRLGRRQSQATPPVVVQGVVLDDVLR